MTGPTKARPFCLLAVLGMAGATFAAETPKPQAKPVVHAAPQAPAPAESVAKAATTPVAKSVSPAKPAASPETALARLKALVESAEKLAEAEEWDDASAKVDEAEVLIADWSAEVLGRPDVAPLIERLRAVNRLLEEDDEEGEGAGGLKDQAEGTILSAEQLKAERDQVLAAEAGAVFDFPIDLNDKVLTWVNIFTGRLKSKIEASLSRGSSYLPMIRKVFAEEGIPQDLAFLPIVESGYINHARSYAKAVGMWQFMRATGRMYGLNASAWVEERKDPVKATRAAARLLKHLYEREGDWYLALVGYNAGPLYNDRASQALGSRNFWDMARSRHLRDATKSYVPQMCAAVLVGRFPERYGLTVTQGPLFTYDTVEVDRMTSLAVLARHAGTDVESLKHLNPELLRSTTPPGKYQLRVPPGSGASTAGALAKIPSSDRVDFQRYVIRKGDTVAKVAARFKISREDLLEANGLKASQFKAGRRIQIPPPTVASLETKEPKRTERPSTLAERPLEPVPVTPGATKPSGDALVKPDVAPAPVAPAPEVKPEPRPQPQMPQPRARTHRVKAGETLYSISQRYGISLADLRRWNRIRGNYLQAGQLLKLHP